MRSVPIRFEDRCFTLVELAVIVAVILILVGLLLPWFNAAREKSRGACCNCNLKQIGLSLKLYSGDNKDRYPVGSVPNSVVSALGLLTNNYQTSYKVWVCSSDTGVTPGSPTKAWGSSNLSYAYGGFGLGEFTQPDTPIVADRTSTFGSSPGQAWAAGSTTPYSANKWTHKADGGSVLFVDGHVAFTKTWAVPPYSNWRNP